MIQMAGRAMLCTARDGQGDPSGHRLGVAQRQLLGNELAKNDRHEGQPQDDGRQGNGRVIFRKQGERRGRQPVAQRPRQRRPAKGRSQRRDQRHAHLHRRQEFPGIGCQIQCLLRRPVMGSGLLFQPVSPGGQNGHLGRGKKAVGQDQSGDNQQFKGRSTFAAYILPFHLHFFALYAELYGDMPLDPGRYDWVPEPFLALRLGWLGVFARLAMTLQSSQMGRGGHRDDRRRRLLAEDLTANSGPPAQDFGDSMRNGQPPAHKSAELRRCRIPANTTSADRPDSPAFDHLFPALEAGFGRNRWLDSTLRLDPGSASATHSIGQQWLIWVIAEAWETGSPRYCFLPPACWRSSPTPSAAIKLMIIMDIIMYGFGRQLAGCSWRRTWPPVFTSACSK